MTRCYIINLLAILFINKVLSLNISSIYIQLGRLSALTLYVFPFRTSCVQESYLPVKIPINVFQHTRIMLVCFVNVI